MISAPSASIAVDAEPPLLPSHYTPSRNRIYLRDACPSCGHRCQWMGAHIPENGGTEWTIYCRRCRP